MSVLNSFVLQMVIITMCKTKLFKTLIIDIIDQ